MNYKITTGNEAVDAVGRMNLTGNVIPESWYLTITNDKGKVNPLAILILSDIVYWYRPTEIRDEVSNITHYEKKFHDDDYLQRSYEQLMDKFNISKRQARAALIILVNLGVVERHFRNITVAGLSLSNVMFIELDSFGHRNSRFNRIMLFSPFYSIDQVYRIFQRKTGG